MDHSYTGLIVILVFVIVYTLYISSYVYVSGIKEKYHNFSQNIVKRIPKITNAETDNVDPTSISTGAFENSSFLGNGREKHRRDESITFNICCGAQQRLNTNGNRCVDVIGEPLKNIEFLLENYVVDSNMGHARIESPEFNSKFQFQSSCLDEGILSFEWLTNGTNYYFIDKDSGQLLELDRHTKKISSVFSSNTYCLDQYSDSGTFIVLVCPCSEKICIPKCCRRGFYFNTILNECKDESEDDIQSYTPLLHDTMEETRGQYNYYLIQKQLECSKPEKFISSESEIRPLYVQQNGFLITKLKNERFSYFDRNRYCIDMFSTGQQHQTFVNGFFCPDSDTETAHPGKKTPITMNLRNTDEENISEIRNIQMKLQNLTERQYRFLLRNSGERLFRISSFVCIFLSII